MSKGVSARNVGLFLNIFVCVLLVCPAVEAATKASVDKIRSSNTLRDADLKILEEFVGQQFSALALAKDSAEASKVAKTLIECALSTSHVPAATKKSYSDGYSRAVKGVYDQAWQQGKKKLESQVPLEQEIGRHLTLSTVIVLAKCDNLILVDDLLRMLKDPSEEIQYWAAKGLAGENLQSALTNDTQNSELIQSILKELSLCLDKTNSGLVISQIALAAGLLDSKASVAILERCVSKRIARYQRWNVINESTDMVLLMQLLKVAENDTLDNMESTRKKLLQNVADLYTLAYLRYVTGTQYLDTDETTPLPLLQEQNQQYLRSLLIEVELEILLQVRTPKNGPKFSAVVQSDNSKILDKAWKTLIGTDGVTEKIWEITSTIQLSDPPEEVVRRARNLRDIKNNLIGG